MTRFPSPFTFILIAAGLEASGALSAVFFGLAAGLELALSFPVGDDAS